MNNALGLILGLYLLTTDASVAIWNGNAGDGKYLNPSNWDIGQVPNAANFDVVINITDNIFLSSAITVRSLTIMYGNLYVNGSTLTLNYLSLSQSGKIGLINSQLTPTGGSANVSASDGSFFTIEGSETNCTIPIYIYEGAKIYVNADGVTFDYLSLKGWLTISDRNYLTINNGFDLYNLVTSNGTLGSIIWVKNNFNWWSGEISGVNFVVYGNSTFQSNNDHKLNNGVTFQNNGTIWWSDGALDGNNVTFLNYGTMKALAVNSGTCKINGTGTFRNWGIVDCSVTMDVDISNWDVYSWSQWIGNFYHHGGGYIWFNEGTSINGNIKLNGDVCSFVTSFEFQSPTYIYAEEAVLQTTSNGNVTIQYMEAINCTFQSVMDPTVGFHFSGSFNMTQVTFQDTTVVLELDSVTNFKDNEFKLLRGHIINYGLWNWYSTDYFTLGNSTVTNLGEIYCFWEDLYLRLSIKSSDSTSTAIIENFGLLYLDISTFLQVYDGVSFTQCGDGTLSFNIIDPSKTPYITFDNKDPGELNLDGNLQIRFKDMSTVMGVTSSGMTLVYFNGRNVSNTYLTFTGGIGIRVYTINDPDVPLSTCWSVDSNGVGTGTVYKTTDYSIKQMNGICLPTNLTSTCPSILPPIPPIVSGIPTPPTSPASPMPLPPPTVPSGGTPSSNTTTPIPIPVPSGVPSEGHIINISVLTLFTYFLLLCKFGNQ